LGPARDDLIEREGRGLASIDGAIELLAIRRPAGVMDRHAACAGRLRATLAFFKALRGEAARRDLGVGGRAGDIFRNGPGLGRLGDGDELDVETEHPGGRARTTTVGEFFWDPEASFFAFLQELKALGPTRNDAVEREARGLTPVV